MKTELLYLKDSYLKASEAEIIDIEVVNDKLAKLILDQTIFFAEGGGQPSDQGIIKVKEETYKVKQVRLEDGEIKHYIQTINSIPEKGTCYLEIDWDRRYKNMQVHSAGHILDWAVSELKLHNDSIIPSKGSHGKKPFVEYLGKNEKINRSDIQKRVNSILSNNLKINTKFVTFEELEKEALYIFPNLPKDKPLRVVQLEGYRSVPDGGTLVAKSGEIETIIVDDIVVSKDHTTIGYKVEFGSSKEIESEEGSSSIDEIVIEINTIKDEFSKEISDVETIDMFENLKIKYTGKKSKLTNLLKSLKNFKHEDKAKAGKVLNEFKQFIFNNLDKKENQINESILNEAVSKEWLDVTEPGIKPQLGTIHPTTKMLWKATDIFQKMGFEVIEPTEVDNDFNHFTALNIPEEHPARDMWDTFWTEDDQIAIAHTSTMQNRVLSNLKPPIRAIAPGRCFRNEATDASHEHTFFQVEGVYLDKGITLADLMSTMKTFLEKFLERDVKIKIQPSYFPFVEPGLEILIDWNDRWLEVMPAGMIHPNVLKAAGIDSNIYSGFAWGFGLDRLVMIKYGIDDIRHLHGGDLRFLKQF